MDVRSESAETLHPLSVRLEHFDDEERSRIGGLVIGRVPTLLSGMLRGEHLSSAEADDCADREMMVRRWSGAILERTVSVLNPSTARTLRIMYPEGSDELLGSGEVAKILGIKPPAARTMVHVARKELKTRVDQISEERMDYVKWGEGVNTTIDRRNVLIFMSKVGADIPSLASLGDLNRIASERLASAATISDEEKRMITALYHLGGTGIASRAELGTMFNMTPAVAVNAVKRAVGRITTGPVTGSVEKFKNGNAILPPLPDDDPEDSLRLIRESVRAKRLSLGGGTDTPQAAYIYAVRSKMAEFQTAEPGTGLTQEVCEEVATKAIRLILRYRKRARMSLEGNLESDAAIIIRYALDSVKLDSLGFEYASNITASLSPQDVENLYECNSDLPQWLINDLIEGSRKDPERNIRLFRGRFEAAQEKYAGMPGMSPSTIMELCMKEGSDNLDRYAKMFEVLRGQYAMCPEVTTIVLSRAIIKSIDPGARIEGWVRRRRELLRKYPAGRDISPTFIGRIADQTPRGLAQEADPESAYLRHEEKIIASYRHNLRRLRQEFRMDQDVPDDVLVKVAQTYLNGSIHARVLQQYRTVLSSLRQEFAGDDMADEDACLHYAKQYLSGNTKRATEAMMLYKARLRTFRLRYDTAPGVDDAMLRKVAMVWPNTPEAGVRTLMLRRRRSLTQLDSMPIRVGEAMVSQVVRNSAAQVDDEETKELQRERIAERLLILDDNERRAVLLVFGLYETDNSEAEQSELCKLLATDDLPGYVEALVLPKLQAA